MIVQSGIKKVVYINDPSNQHQNGSGTFDTSNNKEENKSDEQTPSTAIDEDCAASRIMLQLSGVETKQYTSTQSQITLDFGLTSVFPSLLSTTTGNNEDKSMLSGRKMPPLDTAAAAEAEKKRVGRILQKEANYKIQDDDKDTVISNSSPEARMRTDYLSWDDYFMAAAFLTAKRSKDPNTQVGACIVNTKRRIVGMGYNGFPRGCSDDVLPWDRKSQGGELFTKYPYVCHAEVNAILNKSSADVSGATIYVALFPCNECAKMIIQAGLREVVFLNDTYHETDSCRASRIMFEMSGIKLRQYSPTINTITLNLAS